VRWNFTSVVEEKGFGLFLAAVAVGRGDQFLGLGHGHGGEQIGNTGRSARRSQT
jgi:hypothetical protein